MFDLFYDAALKGSTPEKVQEAWFHLALHAREPMPPFFTVAGRLAAQNKLKAVERLRQLGANPSDIAAGFAFAENHEQVSIYQDSFQADPSIIAFGYALAKNEDKVKEYCAQFEIDVNVLIMAYIFNKDHTKVKEHRIIKQENINAIARGYALTNDYEQAEKYRVKYGADINEIVKGFVFCGNHKIVEEYRTSHNADVAVIASSYTFRGNDIPPFYRAINILGQYGQTGKTVIDSMVRLKHGQDQFWNPYWMNSGVKLDKIIAAVESLPEDVDLKEEIKNPDSKLYKALNSSRISPITFLGQLGFYHAKSLKNVTDEIIRNEIPSAQL